MCVDGKIQSPLEDQSGTDAVIDHQEGSSSILYFLDLDMKSSDPLSTYPGSIDIVYNTGCHIKSIALSLEEYKVHEKGFQLAQPGHMVICYNQGCTW